MNEYFWLLYNFEIWLLEDDLTKLNIDINKSSKKIINGINLLRLGNNPVKIEGIDIYNIISKNI